MIIWMKKIYIMDSLSSLYFTFQQSVIFLSKLCEKQKLSWNSRSDSSKVLLPLGVEVSSRDFLLPLRAARGLFPHSGGWPAWCVSWVWPPVPCSNGQNLQNHHAQLDKVGRIIHLSLVWAPSERGRGLELIAAMHQRLFIATFSLLAFAPWASNSELWFDARIKILVFQNM